MASLTYATGCEAYYHIVHHVLKTGILRNPRNLATLDAGPTTITLDTPHDALPLGQGRGLSRAIAAVEAMQLIAGYPTPSLVNEIAPQFTQYMNPRGYFHGAYGDRVKDQVNCAVNKLQRDIHSRQAIVTLWDPWLDNIDGEADYPCTVGFGFAVRDQSVTMNVIMRSSDVWLGIPYDLFQFTQLQISVARALNLTPGEFTLHTWSLHMYQRDVPTVERHLTPAKSHVLRLTPGGFGTNSNTWTEIRRRAYVNLCALELNLPLPDHMTTSERWYYDAIAAKLGRVLPEDTGVSG